MGALRTRARAQTHVYAGRARLDELDPGGGRSAEVAAVAERMGRTEPEVPSIAVPLAHEQQVEVEHARESQPTPPPDKEEEPERPRDRGKLSELRAERDRLRAVVDSYPTQTVREIARLQGQAAVQRQGAGEDEWRAAHWQGVYDDLGVLRRRGRDGRDAREQAERFAGRADEQYQRAGQLEQQARGLAEGPDGPAGWERAHPGVREEYRAETRLAAAVDRRAREPVDQVPVRSRGSDPARGQLAWLRSERDWLRDELYSYPHPQARAAEDAEQRAGLYARDAQGARERAGEAEREYGELGRLARRGQRGTRALERQQRFTDQAREHEQRARSERQGAQEIREQPGGPIEWERTHLGVRDRLAVYEHAYEAAEAQETRRALMRDPGVAVRVLGSRPRAPEEREVWDRGARAIAGYRLAYEVTDRRHVLGQEPDRDSPGGLEQHRDWEARRRARAAGSP